MRLLVRLHHYIVPAALLFAVGPWTAFVVRAESSVDATATGPTIAAARSATTATGDGSSSCSITDKDFEDMLHKVQTETGIIAALDQSGGSTPKALENYGYPTHAYDDGDISMYDAIHDMRCRIITSPAFVGDKILGAILFENTALHRHVDHIVVDEKTKDYEPISYPTPEYLWKVKHIVPFLKVDKGLEDEHDGVQLMKPISGLNELLVEAKSKGIFGTKMRSVIHSNNPVGIENVVKQQFDIGKQIIHAGLVPILEPEVNIQSDTKYECEVILKQCLLQHLDALSPSEKVMIKVSIPTKPNFYEECINHPNCIKFVALSGGYTREEASALLKNQPNMIASFSRALTEGLSYNLSDDEFNTILNDAISTIYEASK